VSLKILSHGASVHVGKNQHREVTWCFCVWWSQKTSVADAKGLCVMLPAFLSLGFLWTEQGEGAEGWAFSAWACSEGGDGLEDFAWDRGAAHRVPQHSCWEHWTTPEQASTQKDLTLSRKQNENFCEKRAFNLMWKLVSCFW